MTGEGAPSGGRATRWLFAGTVGLGAALLFGVQPMAARALLPAFGGSAAVWTLCLVFFQGALLLGYGWAHLSLRRLGERRQAVAQLALVVVPLVLWPVSAAALSSEPGQGSPTLALLGALAHGVGGTFVVLSTTSPVLSRWFAARAGSAAGGAYALYAASNAGSLGSLLAYPLLVEPRAALSEQVVLLQRGYALYAVAVLACAVSLWRHRGEAAVSVEAPMVTGAPAWRRRLGWVGLAAVPSSLLSSLTTYLTTDIASLPLLWVLPLGLYLASFILIYRERPLLTVAQSARVLPMPLLMLALLLTARATGPGWLLVVVTLAVTFLSATLAHGLRYDDRPEPARLTEFYMLSSLGGALGGAFTALVAPHVFRELDELPLGLVAVAALRALAVRTTAASSVGRDHGRAALMTVHIVAGLHLSERTSGPSRSLVLGVVFVGVALTIYRDLDRPRRFTMGIAALLIGRLVGVEASGRLFVDRSFFGTMSVRNSPEGSRVLNHGSTVHGVQRLDPALRDRPAAYYHADGPLGDAMRAWWAKGSTERVGVVGLGAGAMASYARPGEHWVYYELDPLVARVAEDPHLFTFLSDARTRVASLDVVIGDARRQLLREPDGSFGLLVVDAFSSDSIPLHLVTREALVLYRRVVSPDGLVVMHVSNRFLDLPPVLAATAASAGLALRCRDDRAVDERTGNRSPRQWGALRAPGSTVKLDPARWPPPRPAPQPWTDARASLLEALSWERISQ